MASSLESILGRDALLDLAGERYFERGEGYNLEGRVRSLVEHEGTIRRRSSGRRSIA